MTERAATVSTKEQARLEALHRLAVLDSPAEARFDRITALAAHALRAPMAHVALIDEHRQWFKSTSGFTLRQTPRSVALCAQTILGSGVFAVEDTRTDPRFAGNPLVLGEPFIGAYAGAPLLTADGHAVGTLAVMDQAPRVFTETDRQMLVDLAAIVVDELRLRLAHGVVQDALDETAGALRAVLDASPVGIVRIDGEGRITGWNSAASKIYRQPSCDVVGRHYAEISSGRDVWDALWARVRAGESVRDVRMRRRRQVDGSTIEVRVAASPLPSLSGPPGAVCIIEDVTEQVAGEQKLLAADRALSLATMAAGVAHEINNPLTFVLTHLQILAASSTLGERDARLVAEARDGAERIRAIVRDMSSFGRATEQRAPLDLRAVVDEALKLVRDLVASRARIVRAYEAVPPVVANASRLAQVLVNLLSNAAQAIPPGAPDANVVEVGTSTDAEGRAVVTVRDTGRGMSDEVRRRLFDPFFTTKDVDTGTGLGLFVSRSIVDAEGGTIDVTSTPGKGSVFRVALPPATASS